jgi:colanic acid/amylovoran biosynthesis glycosyltransferase
MNLPVKNITLAIFSPNQSAYSETFIQAHKHLPFNVKFYYEGLLPTMLEGKGNLCNFTLRQRIRKRFNRELNLKEHALLNSLILEKADVVLTEFGPTGCVSLKVIQQLQLPMVAHFFGSDTCAGNILEQYAGAYQEVFSYASAIVVVCEKMKIDLVRLGCPTGKITVSVCGPQPFFFDAKPSYTSKQFIAVGRFVEKKGPYLTLLAFKKVSEIYPDAKLLMVGNGLLLETCKNLVKALHLHEQVKFVGVQTPLEILALFQESLAFVQHSITLENGDAEGTPVAVLDAQAAALPVVSTFHAGIQDVVAHERTGFLSGEKNVDEMADNMLRLLQEDGLARQLGAAGRERTRKYFSLEKHLEDLARVIKNVR